MARSGQLRGLLERWPTSITLATSLVWLSLLVFARDGSVPSRYPRTFVPRLARPIGHAGSEPVKLRAARTCASTATLGAGACVLGRLTVC